MVNPRDKLRTQKKKKEPRSLLPFATLPTRHKAGNAEDEKISQEVCCHSAACLQDLKLGMQKKKDQRSLLSFTCLPTIAGYPLLYLIW